MDGTKAAMNRLDDDIMGATEAGRWVSYVYRNPGTGEEGASTHGSCAMTG